MSEERDIFDRNLLARRRNRAAPALADHEFLLSSVADDLLERLAIAQRRFPVALNLGAYHGLLGRRLKEAAGIETVIDMELAEAPLRACGGLRVRDRGHGGDALDQGDAVGATEVPMAGDLVVLRKGLGQEIALADLPSEIQATPGESSAPYVEFPESGLDLPAYLASIEKDLIRRALDRTSGNRNKAADLLRIKRTTLVEKLKRIGAD